MTPATLRSRRRNFADIKYRISYKDEEEKEYKEAILIIDKGFASIFTPTQELITRLDLLEYVIVPLPKFMEFTLVNNNNVHHLFSVNDLPLFDHIILRVYNESILAQTSFINNAPPEFAKFVISLLLFLLFSFQFLISLSRRQIQTSIKNFTRML